MLKRKGILIFETKKSHKKYKDNEDEEGNVKSKKWV